MNGEQARNTQLAKQIFSGSASGRSAAINRRKFTQTVLASLPAASLACALPATTAGSDVPFSARPQFVCVVDVMFELPDFSVYLAMNCTTQETWSYADVPGLPISSCSDPIGTRCMKSEFFGGLARTDDVLNIVLSPNLNQHQLEKIDLFRSALLMNMT